MEIKIDRKFYSKSVVTLYKSKDLKIEVGTILADTLFTYQRKIIRKWKRMARIKNKNGNTLTLYTKTLAPTVRNM